jgi:hypothetical protein
MWSVYICVGVRQLNGIFQHRLILDLALPVGLSCYSPWLTRLPVGLSCYSPWLTSHDMALDNTVDEWATTVNRNMRNPFIKA